MRVVNNIFNQDKLDYTNMTANKAYEIDMSWRQADGEEKKSFKDWLGEQKEKGNIDKAGQLIYEKIFGKRDNSGAGEEMYEQKPDSYIPKDEPKSTKILGMPKGVAIGMGIAVAVLIGFGIYSMVKAKKKS